jgi:NTE family protein
MCDELNFADLLDDGGVALKAWQELIDDLSRIEKRWMITAGKAWWSYRKQFSSLIAARGLYSGDKLEAKLRSLILRKHGSLEGVQDITFTNLRELGCSPLKVVASNLHTRRSVVMSDEKGSPTPNVLTAVRASCSYPFLFRPVLLHRAPLVDGGLASNLPVWLFNDERDQSGLPLVAFELKTRTIGPVNPSSDVKLFLLDLLETALESGDALLRSASARLYHIEVPISSDIRSLDFRLPLQRRYDLYNDGLRETLSYFSERFVQPNVSLSDPAGQLEAVYGEKSLFSTILRGFISEVMRSFPNSGTIRSNIMLPYGNSGNWVVAYQVGMDGDPDVDLIIQKNGGPVGDAIESAGPIVSDWTKVRPNPEASAMTRAQTNKIPVERQAVASIPIFDLRKIATIKDGLIRGLTIRGVLSIDSDRETREAGWTGLTEEPTTEFIEILKRWSDVIGRTLN